MNERLRMRLATPTRASELISYPCLGLGPFDRLSAAQYCRSLTLKAPCDNFTYCFHPESTGKRTCQASEVIRQGESGDSIFSALTECLYRALAMGNPSLRA
ncbi:HXXXD-type acyl-transferase family protein [Striga asiatica]|uniref:HXXXD-type acyl-transferase family protein n=1 Tax=Striga asiatica TaxID=4170 RepID=A0A5A7Q046_STRAF|nr:HXXXD-type acyl-transferase family protein [Striga asiatica]